jgi:hypothetical protein
MLPARTPRSSSITQSSISPRVIHSPRTPRTPRTPRIAVIKKPDENIFDLSALVSIEKDIEVKKYSTSEATQSNLLKQYNEVPQAEWRDITPGTHVRYLRKDGQFRKGGYVKNLWSAASGARKGEMLIQLGNNQSFRAKKWQVFLDDIDKIWAKKYEREGVVADTETMDHLKKTVNQLKVDVAKLTNEQQRVVNLIKKLHGITRGTGHSQ